MDANAAEQGTYVKRLPARGLSPQDLLPLLAGAVRVLLESTRVSAQGRWSYVVVEPQQLLQLDSFEALRGLIEKHHTPRPAGAPPFFGGLIGYIGYEANRHVERVPRHRLDDLGMPDMMWVLAESVIAFDHESDEIVLVSPRDEDIELMAALVERARPLPAPVLPVEDAAFQSNFTHSEYSHAVERVREYIAAGDTYQVNLSQRLRTSFEGDAFELYRRLSALSPVHFGAYLDFGDFQIASASPERLARLESGRVLTRPIAGTRRRGTEMEDQQFLHELRTDEKERAEHCMLVDLERNDIGRVCQLGSVRVTKLMELVKYASVIHIESEVEGVLAPGRDFVDLIRAVFPGGTVTGVPKVRTMEIIAELEPHVRGPYTGSIGWISFAGDIDLNIVIRTIVLKDGQAYINVGAGIVHDSVPAREYKETLNKARSQLRALGPAPR